ncbi:protein-disulfide reductase DsbD domain-containing protein [Thioalkalicoccus limnaeus]|uniref:Protein-disulfide reductase DsbD domain-containing protein n=1 Tax=Thioalkalicoccus limnaeus TaxID=120681 RepID=A0ABV4BDN8_9GAMM
MHSKVWSHGRYVGLWMALSLFGAFNATAAPVVTDQVTVQLVAERDQVAPGQSVDLALVFDIRPGWHTYWRNPGDSGEPLRVQWSVPEGVVVGSIQWPYPTWIPVGPLANYGYEDRVSHLQTLSVPADWPVGEPVRVAATADWLVCKETCLPQRGEFSVTLATAAEQGAVEADRADVFRDARRALPEAEVAGWLNADDDGLLRLSVAADDLPANPAGLWFFAGEWGLIDHAAKQSWRLSGGRVEIDLAPGDLASQAGATGLLVVAAQDGAARSFEVVANRDRPAVAPDPIGADTLSLPLALLFALVGGLLLNLMPCVFPVLAMKAMSLLGQHGLAKRERVAHGLAYTLGVLVFFGALAGLLLALRAGGEAVGWGFQLQYPPFVALMAYLFLVLGLGLAGMATFGARLMGLGSAQLGSGTGGAFGTGALAALVAAPCTAPFMGAALGFAVTLSWPLALLVILTLGLGLALPFLVLALVPGLARRLPRPGAWMETLKQLLAFPLFGAAIWLVWVLSHQTGPGGVAAVLSGMLLLAFALWLWERTRNTPGRWRSAGAVMGVAAVGLALYLGVATGGNGPSMATPAAAARDGGPVDTAAFSEERLAQARADGRPVFVNMTAAWCITCLVNEQVALDRSAITGLFADQNVLYLKGDWTNQDPAITAYLARYGRNGVPLYVFYPPGGEPRVLPQILTENLVRDTVAELTPVSSQPKENHDAS